MRPRPGLRCRALVLALGVGSGCGDDGSPASADGDPSSTGGTAGVVDDGADDAPAGDGGTSMSSTKGEDTTTAPAADDTATDDTPATGSTGDESGPGSSSDDGQIQSVCGDTLVEGLEECDADNLDGHSCTTQGFTGGALSCNADCLFEIAACFNAHCGNGLTEGDEVCDGADLDGGDCISEGFDAGVLACTADCTYDAAGCVTFMCGNDLLEGDEACDGSDLGGASCVSLGFGGGALVCAGDCSDFVTSSCYAGDCCNTAGNGTPGCIDATCTAQICAFDPFCCNNSWDSQCGQEASAGCAACGVVCGDGSVAGAEQCDGANLGGQTCAGLPGFVGGSLSCTGSCTFNTGACTPVPSWSADIQPVWNANCGCHVSGGTQPTFSGVAAATSYANLVNVPSSQVALDFIEPSSSANSYLIHKISGTQAVGAQMPFGGPFLPPATINMISSWIDDGAPNN